MKIKGKGLIVFLALIFIVLEGILSIVYHWPEDQNPLSITNIGRYSRIIAALISLYLIRWEL